MDMSKLHKMFKDNGAFYVDDQGRKQGKMISFHENEHMSAIVSFKDDKRHGVSKTYHSNGALCTFANYLNDKLNGEYRRYDKSGNLQYHAIFANGVRSYVICDENGTSNQSHDRSNVVTLF